jgi:acyl-CoA thioester hydrolase
LSHVIDYQAEVGVGDLMEIHAELVKIGTKSMTVAYEMRNISRNQVAATLKSTSVYFDLKARAAIPITQAMNDSAANFLPS